MGFLNALVDVVSMPIRVGVDVVKMPYKIIDGQDGLLENTVKGIEKIEEDLNED